MDTARALSLVEVTRQVLLPDLKNLVRKLIALAREHAATPQMGRTHGQHAVPLTFGFAVALAAWLCQRAGWSWILCTES